VNVECKFLGVTPVDFWQAWLFVAVVIISLFVVFFSLYVANKAHMSVLLIYIIHIGTRWIVVTGLT